jgi:hypothetical protein
MSAYGSPLEVGGARVGPLVTGSSAQLGCGTPSAYYRVQRSGDKARHLPTGVLGRITASEGIKSVEVIPPSPAHGCVPAWRWGTKGHWLFGCRIA